MAFHSPFYIFYLAFRINEMRFWAHYLFVLGILQTSNSLIVLKSFDASVSFMEGRTAYLNWNANFSEVGETWFSVKIERAKETTVNSPKEVVVKKFVQSGTVKETLYLTSRAADIALNISSMSSNVNITFLLRNVNPTTDDMYYICTVSSNTGNTELNSVWLLILVPSSCKIHPDKNITINETDNVLLNVITTGNPPVYEYIWTHPNGSSLTANSTLTFTASRQDNGTYKVSVYNGVGDRSICKRHITVQFPSSCTIHPDATTVKETDNVLLNVTTTGYPPVYEYIWTHPNGSRLTANSRLTFTASRQDTGTYKVSVYNGFGDRSICTSNVTVQYPPVAVTSKLVIIENYQNGSINCSAPGEPEPTFSWTSTTNRTPLTKDNGRTVVLINATLEDTGNYTCTAKNSLGDSSRTSSVIVAYPVGCTISPDLPNVIVNESGSVTLTCFGKGQPPVNEFSWTYPNGTTHPGTSVLQYRASRTDKKIYHCLVRNSLGRSGNCTRKVTVHFKPKSTSISISPKQTGFCRGSNATISCTSYAKPPAKYFLYRNASQIHYNSISGVFSVSFNDTGKKNYTCVSYNTVGFGQNRSLELVVKEPPKAENCKVTSENMINGSVVEGERVTLSCIITGSDPLNITWTNGSHVWNRVNLTFDSVNRENTGNYLVTVNNGKECNETKGENLPLIVYFPSSCEIHPDKNITVIENDTVSLNVITTGNPPVYEYIWTNPNGSRLTANSRLTFTVSRQDTGTYDVSVYNGVGDRGICTSNVAVQYFGDLTCEAVPVEVKEGDNIALNCSVTAYPPASYTWNFGKGAELTASNVMLNASRDLHNKSFTCTAENSRGVKNCSTTPLKVFYFKRNICSELNFNLVSGSGSQNLSAANPTGFGNPIPILTCVGAQVVVSNSKSIITVNTTVPKNVSCTFINKVGNCFRDITVWKRVPAYKKKSTMQILGMDFNIDLKDNNTQAFIALSKKIKTAILEVYRISGNKYVINIYVITFVEGSVWVNFELELIANVPNPLQPLQDALVQNKGNLSGLMVNESSLSEGFRAPSTSSTVTPTATPSTTTTESYTPTSPTFWEKYHGYIIGAIICVLAVIGLLLVIWWRYRKKRIEKNPVLVNNNNATGDIHAVEGAQARDNAAYSTSDYADRGPSHAEGGKDESAYAAVDMTKKTKKKKPEEKKKELTYAALEDFQPPGGRGGIVLEPLPKGQHTKMPEKYEDTIYAKIVGTKKPASGNQNAAGASNNIPLADMHVQGTETESEPSDQTADPAKQNDHNRPATNKKEKPPDNQGQPPTKEDSGKEESDSAESSVTKF